MLISGPGQTVVVLGAGGRLGHAAALAFERAGWRVVAVTRTGRSLAGLERAEFRAADAEDSSQLLAAVAGADVIFNGLNVPYPEWRQRALPLARSVLEAARASGATQLFPANLYNYGPRLPERLTPEVAFEPGQVRKAGVRVEIERAFASAAVEDGVQTLMLRAGDFYGHGTGSWFDLVIAKDLERGRVCYPGPLDVEHAWAYLPDLAQAFVRLAERRRELPSYLSLGYEGHALTGEQLIAHVETAVGRTLRRSRFPWPLLKLGRAGGLLRRRGRPEPARPS